MFAATSPPITFPSWVERIALPEYPAMPIPAYVMLGFGLVLLLIGYFAPIKKVPALLTAVALLAYYPLAYLVYWFLFRFDEQGRMNREPTKLEVFLLEHVHAFEWVLLGICAFFSLLFFVWTIWATLRKRRRIRAREAARSDNPLTAQPAFLPAARPQPTSARPAVPRSVSRPAAAPQAPPVRKVPKKPPAPPATDNPFNFG